MLRDRRFLTLIAANILAMTIYSLWTNWAPLFLVSAYGLSQAEANLRFVWIPPLFATLGGLLGGWLAQRSIRQDTDVLPARLRIAFGASLVALTTAAAPLAGSPQMATAAICLSLSATTCLSVNYYAIPLDLFGADRAAFGVSFLTSVYGVMQAVLSPAIGRWSETTGWAPVCSLVAILPLVSVLLLRTAFPRKT
jgi:ACS family hexuronate transporter-like MFS transporter